MFIHRQDWRCWSVSGHSNDAYSLACDAHTKWGRSGSWQAPCFGALLLLSSDVGVSVHVVKSGTEEGPRQGWFPLVMLSLGAILPCYIPSSFPPLFYVCVCVFAGIGTCTCTCSDLALIPIGGCGQWCVAAFSFRLSTPETRRWKLASSHDSRVRELEPGQCQCPVMTFCILYGHEISIHWQYPGSSLLAICSLYTCAAIWEIFVVQKFSVL